MTEQFRVPEFEGGFGVQARHVSQDAGAVPDDQDNRRADEKLQAIHEVGRWALAVTSKEVDLMAEQSVSMTSSRRGAERGHADADDLAHRLAWSQLRPHHIWRVLEDCDGPLLARLAQLGKQSARTRLDRLLDPATPFLELSTLTGITSSRGEARGASCITGIGIVAGREVAIHADDPSIKGAPGTR